MKKFACILFSILLSACAGPTTPAPSATPKAIDLVTLEVINTPTITMQPLTTATLPPTPTEDTAEQANNQLATKERPTKVARATRIAAEFGVVCYGSDQIEYISPNGNWIATACGDKQNAIFEIANRQGKRWVLQLKDYVPDGWPGGFHSEHWSNDGEYLYFSLSLGMSGGGYVCFYDFGAQGLYRIRLNDGTVSPVLSAGNDFSFSPTGRRLAYGLGDLVIRDLQTGNETSINTGDSVFGPFLWSPDGLELAYATCQDDGNDSIKKSTVKIFSIQQDISRTILEMEKKFLTIESWDENDVLTIYSRDENYLSNTQLFDVNSNQWITPTTEP